MAYNVGERRQPNVDVGQQISPKKGMKSSDASIYESSDEVTIDTKKSGVTTIHKSSKEFYEYNCDPCKGAGDNAEAEGFCTDCEEYLCSACFRAHSRTKLLKHHVLLGRDDMPRKSPKVCNPCKTSGDETQAVGYCEDCCDFLCDNCFRYHPRNKFTRNHVLIKTADARDEVDCDVTTSVDNMNIKRGGVMAKEEYIYVRDINVKSDTDKKDSLIIYMTLVSNNEIVLCDYKNQCLKLVDIEKNMIKDVLALQSFPGGITTISNDQIAVVLANKYQIQIVTIRGGKLTLHRKIKTNGDCVSVKMINKYLYVSFWRPVMFQILQPNGEIIKTIKSDDEVITHCTFPAHIAVSPDESVIYVSDWQSNKVISLDMNGNMIALYQGELDHPVDIIISPSKSIYVCNRGKNILYKIKSDLSTATVMLVPGDGLEAPHAICMDTNTQHLYISSGSTEAKYGNVLKVFKC